MQQAAQACLEQTVDSMTGTTNLQACLRHLRYSHLLPLQVQL